MKANFMNHTEDIYLTDVGRLTKQEGFHIPEEADVHKKIMGKDNRVKKKVNSRTSTRT